MNEVWHAITTLVKANQLRDIFIEASFLNEQPDGKLFGHLSPAVLMKEMQQLALLASADELQQVPIIITHIKPTGINESIIKAQLKTNNVMQLKLIFPKQGKPISL